MTAGDSAADDRIAPSKYPEAPRSETVDDYHGRKVADPYRPLEDPDVAGDPRLGRGRERVTFAFLESIPEREAIRRRLTELWDYEKYGPPLQRGRPVLLHLQQRAPEPERPLHVRALDGRAAGPARPQHALRRRDRRPAGRRSSKDGRSARLRHRRGGLRLAGVEGPRRRDRPRPPDSSSGSSSRGPRGPRTAGASTTAGSPSPSRART